MDVDASCVSRIPKRKKKRKTNEKTGNEDSGNTGTGSCVDRTRGRKVAASEKWEMGTRIRSEISSCACIIGRRNALRQAEADETAIFHGRGRRKPETGLAEHVERSCTRTIVSRTRKKLRVLSVRDRK